MKDSKGKTMGYWSNAGVFLSPLLTSLQNDYVEKNP